MNYQQGLIEHCLHLYGTGERNGFTITVVTVTARQLHIIIVTARVRQYLACHASALQICSWSLCFSRFKAVAESTAVLYLKHEL
jgi:hypothetical protein